MHMELAREKQLHGGRRTGEGAARLNVIVVYTSVAATLGALRGAATLARPLGAKITLVVPQIVPYPLPLASPPVLLDFNERRFQAMAEDGAVETAVRIYLCRDRWDALGCLLPPRSLVVLGGKRRWWPTAERRTARKLRGLGHEVVLLETE